MVLKKKGKNIIVLTEVFPRLTGFQENPNRFAFCSGGGILFFSFRDRFLPIQKRKVERKDSWK
jgi:hypothetical protein